jgi:hypothetical protein
MVHVSAAGMYIHIHKYLICEEALKNFPPSTNLEEYYTIELKSHPPRYRAASPPTPSPRILATSLRRARVLCEYRKNSINEVRPATAPLPQS